MQIWTKLEPSAVEKIAADLDMRLNDESWHQLRDGRYRYRLTIRPVGETWRKINANTGRRVWAVCWHGHYAFMRDVFAADRDARIKSGMADYRGVQDFLDNAYETAYTQVGSLIYPRYAAEDCAGNHSAGWMHLGDLAVADAVA